MTKISRAVRFAVFLLVAACAGVAVPASAAKNVEAPESAASRQAAPAQPKLDHSGRKRVGKASFYAKRFAGRKMASGNRMDRRGNNAASRTLPIASEGGHIGFSPATRFEQQVLEHPAARFERVSWERILSGPGLELIDEVSRHALGQPDAPRTAQQIVDAAQAGSCPAARHSVACFAGLLGSFGGDLALIFRAGGVVIGGGVAARLAPLISLPEVRERFGRKGRFSDWLGALPLAILLDPNAALNGAARAFAERFAQSVDTSP
ncbi:MAG: glucokinase [Rhodocyclaceae bacterium]